MTEKPFNFFDKTEGHHSYLEKRFGIRVRAEIARQLLGDLINSDILDIGCGDGTISHQFFNESNHLTLMDTSKNMLKLARENSLSDSKKNITYLEEDFLTYPFNSKYDVILMIGVLAHLPSLNWVFEKIYDLLRKDGKFILQFTDSEKIISKVNFSYYKVRKLFGNDNYRYDINKTKFSEIKKRLLNESFQIEKINRYSLLIPGMGRLPDEFLYQLQMLSLNNKFLSHMGSELLSKG